MSDERPPGLGEPGTYQTYGYLLIPVYAGLLAVIIGVGVLLVVR